MKHTHRFMLFCVGAIVIVGTILALTKWLFPFGYRGCTLHCMHLVLQVFAEDHQGKYPESTEGGFAALQQLYPQYTQSARELAGISGSEKAVTERLAMGKKIDGSVSSWVYQQGFTKSDDPRFAIMWEARSGLYANGRRNFSGSRCVLLLDGTITNVSGTQWQNFLNFQTNLLKMRRATG